MLRRSVWRSRGRRYIDTLTSLDKAWILPLETFPLKIRLVSLLNARYGPLTRVRMRPMAFRPRFPWRTEWRRRIALCPHLLVMLTTLLFPLKATVAVVACLILNGDAMTMRTNVSGYVAVRRKSYVRRVFSLVKGRNDKWYRYALFATAPIRPNRIIREKHPPHFPVLFPYRACKLKITIVWWILLLPHVDPW